MAPVIEVLEVGTTAVAATIAAFHLGLYPLELQIALFFTLALGGQIVTAIVARTAPIPRSGPPE